MKDWKYYLSLIIPVLMHTKLVYPNRTEVYRWVQWRDRILWQRMEVSGGYV
jgi:hypothetical protein